ncbi:hypothetical protein GJAV_G00113830 [Gymnothorax javanicus]|nr:hypothetical protein GJAV_G00113830 [Gymnothorax javanicus]
MDEERDELVQAQEVTSGVEDPAVAGDAVSGSAQIQSQPEVHWGSSWVQQRKHQMQSERPREQSEETCIQRPTEEEQDQRVAPEEGLN